jgi:hypothetical protein
MALSPFEVETRRLANEAAGILSAQTMIDEALVNGHLNIKFDAIHSHTTAVKEVIEKYEDIGWLVQRVDDYYHFSPRGR